MHTVWEAGAPKGSLCIKRFQRVTEKFGESAFIAFQRDRPNRFCRRPGGTLGGSSGSRGRPRITRRYFSRASPEPHGSSPWAPGNASSDDLALLLLSADNGPVSACARQVSGNARGREAHFSELDRVLIMVDRDILALPIGQRRGAR